MLLVLLLPNGEFIALVGQLYSSGAHRLAFTHFTATFKLAMAYRSESYCYLAYRNRFQSRGQLHRKSRGGGLTPFCLAFWLWLFGRRVGFQPTRTRSLQRSTENVTGYGGS
jgi:hypothetical protein